MDWNDFYKAIKEERYQSVYLFAGPEELTKREALEALRRAILPPGLEALNEATLEGCGAQAIIDSAETLPVMCARRIVVVRDWLPLSASKVKSDEADIERMLEWLKNPPESCILIFYMSVEMDGRKKLPTTLKKMGAYVEFNHLSGALLLKWCNQQLRPVKKKIQPEALNELTMMAGQDLNRLSGELKKLSAFVGDAPEISVADVRAIVAPSPEYTVFMILDHLLEGRLAEATKVVNTVLQTEPSAVRLIALFASQLRIDAHMKYALETGGNLPEVQRALNVSDARARFVLRQIRPLSADALRQRYEACVEADFAIKSGQIQERAALNALMLKIVMPRRATR